MARQKKKETAEEKQSRCQHERLMARVEGMIRAIYAVKDNHPHQMIWFLTSALEVYKRQSTLMYLMLDHVTEKERNDFDELSRELTESLTSVCELATPLLRSN